jgi:hypothetical protein
MERKLVTKLIALFNAIPKIPLYDVFNPVKGGTP